MLHHPKWKPTFKGGERWPKTKKVNIRKGPPSIALKRAMNQNALKTAKSLLALIVLDTAEVESLKRVTKMFNKRNFRSKLSMRRKNQLKIRKVLNSNRLRGQSQSALEIQGQKSWLS
jgi:hypothetical protein